MLDTLREHNKKISTLSQHNTIITNIILEMSVNENNKNVEIIGCVLIFLSNTSLLIIAVIIVCSTYVLSEFPPDLFTITF